MKTLLKLLGGLLLAVLVLVTGVVIWLSVTEYRPADREALDTVGAAPAFSGDTVTVLTLNTGYGDLGAQSDFFMDGGKNVRTGDAAYVQQNVDGIAALLAEQAADFYFLQEVDTDSTRSFGIDQAAQYTQGRTGAYALNYCCDWVPFPLPMIGRVRSGLLTLGAHELTGAERVALPCPFSWPVSTANLKRCLLLTRTPLENGRELVLVNLHLEAYDDGAGKLAQTEMLWQVLQAEYEKGNYVIAGGDFNQTFPGSLARYPIADGAAWTPGVLEQAQLPQGWQFAYDDSTPTCRLLDAPYSAATQRYVIDGFILSPNVALQAVQTVDADFRYTDHNPVRLTARLLEE